MSYCKTIRKRSSLEVFTADGPEESVHARRTHQEILSIIRTNIRGRLHRFEWEVWGVRVEHPAFLAFVQNAFHLRDLSDYCIGTRCHKKVLITPFFFQLEEFFGDL